MEITNIAEALKLRGMIEQEAGGEMKDFLAVKRKVYFGVDPTADSMHVGHLVPVLLMKHLADAGHEVLFVVGGGTGMIGDPRESGERVLLNDEIVEANTKALEKQLTKIFGSKQYEIVNNAIWLRKLTIIEFLRDIAKHFTVNQLVKRDIIKRRLDAEDPLSFTEFSYSLLQAYDFLYLNQQRGTDMQVGGSDQWANIVSGVDLIRRKEGRTAYAITTPIIMDKKSGKKFGKSEGNAVWLDPEKTSPYEFYQFWFNVSDEGVEEYLKIFSFLTLEEIAGIMSEHNKGASSRTAQKILAFEVTKAIHGEEAAHGAEKISLIAFGDKELLSNMSESEVVEVMKSMPSASVTSGQQIVEVIVATGLASSKSEARRLVEGKAVRIGEKLIDTPNYEVGEGDFEGPAALMSVGKKVALLSLS